MTQPLKIYVGCSLTHAPAGFVQDVEEFKRSLRERGYQVLDFLGLKGGTAAAIYRHDIHECVGGCDLFLAICDYPSTGLGYELGVAVEKHGTPTLAVAHVDSVVTELVVGVDAAHFRFERYAKLADVLPFVDKLAEMVK